ncbi:Uncharacterised protein [Salmonella enterica subsp. enterica serovar Sanjuan]|uniref:Uncharacterized protein n=1 Tax=Salmonella enterica subsp. enterica serovar Sanjuan TaxID=1160765 RepID=A0A3S5DB67_SALET|nr:Uncharacterised protein [Salmonella enterica subsp. enterica serovar Sanjuan]
MKCTGMIFLCLYSCFSNAEELKWLNECVGYYQFQLPANIELAVYPVDDIIHPQKRSEAIQGEWYKNTNITFWVIMGGLLMMMLLRLNSLIFIMINIILEFQQKAKILLMFLLIRK